ncbi:MAG TPA: hypothetical protein DCZ95_13315 [Verrucomicrobia bacterium]|nr:MAG: hypothetical protein A2X46_11175 [Lentisphaerae bacterium GWF2_57_35]HBA85065.1 hypothetical protein [Verrucomicrobiota bacterium]
MNRFRPLGFVLSLMLMPFLWVSCRSPEPPRSGYVPAEEEGAMTIALDDHDYDLAVAGITRELFTRGLPKDYTVVLGPVDTRESPYDVRVRQIQKSLQVALNKEGTLHFMTAVDAMAGNSAVEEIYKLIQFNWMNSNPIDVEDMQTFGRLLRVNGILFGRVSSLERELPGRMREITYRFVWELSNTDTGLLEISHEEKIRKNVRVR